MSNANQEEQLHILRDALISVIAMLSSVQADCQERCSALRQRQTSPSGTPDNELPADFLYAQYARLMRANSDAVDTLLHAWHRCHPQEPAGAE